MTQLNRNRSNLLLGCGAAALAVSLAAVPERAHAQAFQANETIVSGNVNRIQTGTGTETIQVGSPTAIIDWTPIEDGQGNALDFLPTTAIATFENDLQFQNTDFAVLNRILPATNGNIAVFDGAVISQLLDATGTPTPGGTIAFYSPTGILVGNNAVFDVGNLILTTLDPSSTFEDWAGAGQTGSLDFIGQAGTTARIQIDPGALVLASAENSYFAVVAAEIEMLGASLVNGSTAFIAGEEVNITVSNGLFDIDIPVGTSSATPIVLDGDVGGPSSTGAGDNHMIYAVAAAQNDPISLLFSGNLGFDAAQSAGIVNGEIILSADYAVSGRDVDGGSVSDGINGFFDGTSQLTGISSSITLETFNATSDLLAIANDTVLATTNFSTSNADGNLMLVGRNNAQLLSGLDSLITVGGDVLVSSRGFGLSFQGALDAFGGNASIEAISGGTIDIAGSALVTAEAYAGFDTDFEIYGNATGGQARIFADDASISIGGSAEANTDASTLAFPTIVAGGGVFTGGFSLISVDNGGGIGIVGNANINAIGDASSAGSPGSGPVEASDGIGGFAGLQIITDGTITIGGDAELSAQGIASDSESTNPGGLGQGGDASTYVQTSGLIDIAGGLFMEAFARGGDNVLGAGGDALGGAARAFTENGGTILVGGDFVAEADARGGQGIGGGSAFGGTSGIEVRVGSATISGNASANSSAEGGNSSSLFGFGGDGGDGNGGLSFLQASGNLNSSASLTIGLDASVDSSGRGGDGGNGDGNATPAGAGGAGNGGLFSDPNQADPNFNNGAFITNGGDNAQFSVGGTSTIIASGIGGNGGNGGLDQAGGNGGAGTGGTAQGGQALLGNDGSLGQGTADFGDVNIFADGVGGDGGFGGSTTDPQGNGGAGTGNLALFGASAGTVTAGNVLAQANGIGGAGNLGGDGTGGGLVGLRAVVGGSLTATGFTGTALGIGGSGDLSLGGTGQGGTTYVRFDNGTIQIDGDVGVDATGTGGDSASSDGGDGLGGSADVSVFTGVAGTGTITGATTVYANGLGGNVLFGSGTGGTGTGGEALIQSRQGSTLTFGTIQIAASGQGGTGQAATGGAGFGGFAELRSFDAGSQIVVQSGNTASLGVLSDFQATLSASGIGGVTNGGTGIGGTGTGGEAVIEASGGASVILPDEANSAGLNTFAARGRGGNSTVDGGAGGDATGGLALIDVDNGTLSVGPVNLSPFAIGGIGASPLGIPINVSGGNATGGTRRISIFNGSTVTGEFSSGFVAGLAGSAIGTGTGGSAFGGLSELIVDNSTFNAVGNNGFADLSSGGSGNIGGEAQGGIINVTITGSVINMLPNGSGDTPQFTIDGSTTGGDGVSTGGQAEGADVNVTVTQSQISGGTFNILSNGTGGNADPASGVAGRGRGGAVSAGVVDSQLDLVGLNRISANGQGGAGATGGDGTGGTILAEYAASQIDIVAGNSAPGSLEVTSEGSSTGGESQNGLADGGNAIVTFTTTDLTADDILISTNAFAAPQSGGTAGSAFAGFSRIEFSDGTTASLQNLTLEADAFGGNGATALGGSADVLLDALVGQGEPIVEIVDLDISTDAQGGFNSGPASVPGRFAVEAQAGELRLTNLTGSALGDTLGGEAGISLLFANGGDILVTDNLIVDAFNDFDIASSQGGLIGGPDLLDPSADISITSQGTITISGDDDNFISFGGLSMLLASRDITVNPGARFGAFTVDLVSLDDTLPAILGGDSGVGKATGEGYVLSADEGGRIEVGSLSFVQPTVTGNGADGPDIIIRDVTAFGSLDDGVSSISIGSLANSIIRVEGTFTINDAAPTDFLSITAGDRIEIVTPGGVGVLDPDFLPTGVLSLTADNIWVADSTTIGQLQDNVNFTDRDIQLSTATTGSDDPLGYVRAGTIFANVGETFLVRNTGTATEQGGVTVSEIGGLTITNELGSNDLDVFGYGARYDFVTGDLVTGEAFFNEVNFNNDPNSSVTTTYTAEAAFNDCLINTADCATVTPPPIDPPDTGGSPLDELPPEEAEIVRREAETVNNPAIVEAAVTTVQQVELTEAESDNDFGMDFPGLLEAEGIDEEGNIEDPVASGGDSSLYGQDTSGTVEVEGN